MKLSRRGTYVSCFTNKVNISWIVFRCKVLLKADISSVSSSPGESLKHVPYQLLLIKPYIWFVLADGEKFCFLKSNFPVGLITREKLINLINEGAKCSYTLFCPSLSNKQHWDSKGRFYIKTNSEVFDTRIFFPHTQTNFWNCNFQIISPRFLAVKRERLCVPS